MEKAFVFALQHLTAVEIQGWGCVTPWGTHALGMAGSSSRAGGCYRGVLCGTWSEVVVLHLGSTEGHPQQPCVSVTAQVGFVLPVPG